MHVHIGFAEAAQFTFLLLVVGFFLRSIAAKFADGPVGKALAYIY